jgi:hypothetical protein
MLFFPVFCFAQGLNIVGTVPPSNSDKLYRIQIGAFKEAANAEKAFNSLQNAGLNPVYQNHADYRRVVLTGVNAKSFPLFLYIIQRTGFKSVWIMEERVTIVSVVVKGNGAVTEINTSNKESMAIVQTIPFFSSSGTKTYQANAPLVFFFNNKIYLHSVQGNIDVTVDGRSVNGTAIINEGANGYAVLTFTPNEPFPADKEISVTMKKELQNDGGNPMQTDINLSYTTEQGSQTDFINNSGFESGDNGIVFSGDGAINTARGPLVPHEGSHYAAISTGERIVSEKAAIGSRTSQTQLGPIREPFSSLSFYYNFISAEFNEYVGTRYDDTAMVTIYGPKGSHTEIITSVNIIGHNNTYFANYPKMPDAGDEYAGHTGWQRHNVEKIDVGTPAYIIFSITDVGDSVYSSILAVDSLELK